MCRGLEAGTLKPRLIAGDGVLASLRPLKQTLWSQIKQEAGWAALDSWLLGEPASFTWAGAPLLPFIGLPTGPGPSEHAEGAVARGPAGREPWGGGARAGRAALRNVGLILGSEPARPWHPPASGRQAASLIFILFNCRKIPGT